MILDKARENGASVLEETQAKSLIKSENRVEGVVVESKDLGELELRAPLVIDASGRDCFAAHKEKWMMRDPELKKIALWTYYKGAKLDPGLDEGATTVAYLPGKGWFWYIPLSGDMVSVGIVAEHSTCSTERPKTMRKFFNAKFRITNGSRNTLPRESRPANIGSRGIIPTATVIAP